MEDFLLCEFNDDDDLNRVLLMAKKTAEISTEYLSIFGVRCATHTLELGVKDTIGSKKKRAPTDPNLKHVNAVLAVVRAVAKLRSTKTKIALECEQLPMPVGFIEVRWSSANTMVNKN